jgi:Tfp pilus assembly ATPase PilU
MQTFDQAIFDHYELNNVTYEDALRNADSVTDLKLAIKLHSKRGLPDEQKAINTQSSEGLKIL